MDFGCSLERKQLRQAVKAETEKQTHLREQVNLHFDTVQCRSLNFAFLEKFFLLLKEFLLLEIESRFKLF